MSVVAQNLTPIKPVRKGITAAEYQKMKDKDRELVKGKFIFHECPGGSVSFNFKAYKGEEIERYDLVDGQVYTIPLGVARHLNKNCWYPEYEYIKTERTSLSSFQPDASIMRASKKVRRMSFQSLEFVDMDDLIPTSNLVTIERVASLNTGLHIAI
jgi:hypothetical protein